MGLKGSYTLHACYAPADVWETDIRKGEQSGSSLFGSYGAEPVIALDYIEETHGIKILGIPKVPLALLVYHLGTNTDWFDTGSRTDYEEILVARHKHIKRKTFVDEQFQIPDILTYDGKNLPASKRGRHEYYEIKPDSPSGRRAGKIKLINIEDMYRSKKFRLPYVAGVKYPKAPKELRLLTNNQFKAMVRRFLADGNFEELSMTLEIRREVEGLVVWKVCLKLRSTERMEKKLANAAAKHLYAAYLLAHVPERFDLVAKELGDYTFRGKPFPTIRCDFDVIDSFSRPRLKEFENIMVTRGIGVRGDEFLLCCDESYYRALEREAAAARRDAAPDTIKEMWQWLQMATKPFVDVQWPGAWAQIEPYIAKTEVAAKRFRDAFPDMVETANAILAWMRANPHATVGIIVSIFVVTATMAVLLEPLLLASAVATTESTGGIGLAGASETAFTEQVAARLVTREVAARVAPRFSLAELIKGGVAANDNAAIRAAAVTMFPVNKVVDQLVPDLGTGPAAKRNKAVLTHAISSPKLAAATTFPRLKEAHLLSAMVASAYPGDSFANNSAPQSAPFAQGLSRVYLARSNGGRTPKKGTQIDLWDYALFTNEALEEHLLPRDRKRMETYFLGTVRVS